MSFPIPSKDTFKVNDSTKISCFLGCPRKYFYEYILDWRPDCPHHYLDFGEAWHRAQYLVSPLDDRLSDRGCAGKLSRDFLAVIARSDALDGQRLDAGRKLADRAKVLYRKDIVRLRDGGEHALRHAVFRERVKPRARIALAERQVLFDRLL